MTKTRYVKHPVRLTPWGMSVLRARMSLRETQPEFSKRFMATPVTIHNWESGKSRHPQRIHRSVLDKLVVDLKKQGLWMPDDVFITICRTEVENKGNAVT